MATERLSVFPAFHKVSGRPVLIIGDGGEAVAKVRLLLETDARIRLVSAAPSTELAALVVAHDIEHRARGFRLEDLDGAVLAFAASGERDKDAAVVAAARSRNIPANAVDVPELCDFYTPAIVNRAPVAVAITSTGAGPVLAQHVRARIETLLPMRLGVLARLADSFRPAADRLLPKGQARRRFWSSFFDGAVASAALAGHVEEARSLGNGLLNRASGEENGFVWLVGAGPGAADLLTLRAQRILLEADIIVHDALVPDAVVAMGRRDAERIDVGKRKGRHTWTQEDISALLVAEAKAGRRVVRLKSGDPLVFGRAGEEMAALRGARVPFEIVPGVTSALAAAAEAELPLTLRGVASTLVFATGHDARGGVLPDWAQLALSGATVAVYMGRSVAAEIAVRLIDAGLAPSTPVLIAENASLPDRRHHAGTLADLGALGEGGGDVPALIFIGPAVAHAALDGIGTLGAIRELAA